MGLGPGSVGKMSSDGVRIQGAGSGADSERDCLEKRKILRAPVRSVACRMDFRRVRGLIFCCVGLECGADGAVIWPVMALLLLLSP